MTEPKQTLTIDAEQKTCGTCGKSYRKTFFCRPAAWPSPDSPLCQKCRFKQMKDRGEITDFLRTTADLVKMTPYEEIQFVRMKRLKLINAINQKKIDDASIKDATIGVKNLFTVEQLLQDRPTSIVAHSTREDLVALAKAIREERERRSKIVDVTPVGVPVAAASVEHDDEADEEIVR